VSAGEGAPRAPISPCIGVCILDPASGFCRGCYRTIREIAGWLDLTPEEKHRVVAEAAARKSAAQPPR
jgi:predicted Fe-S protein YdhL (DUF1289 family)